MSGYEEIKLFTVADNDKDRRLPYAKVLGLEVKIYDNQTRRHGSWPEDSVVEDRLYKVSRVLKSRLLLRFAHYPNFDNAQFGLWMARGITHANAREELIVLATGAQPLTDTVAQGDLSVIRYGTNGQQTPDGPILSCQIGLDPDTNSTLQIMPDGELGIASPDDLCAYFSTPGHQEQAAAQYGITPQKDWVAMHCGALLSMTSV